MTTRPVIDHCNRCATFSRYHGDPLGGCSIALCLNWPSRAIAPRRYRRKGLGVRMEALLGQQDSLKTPEAVTKRITIEARRVFEGQAGDAQLEGFARDAVTEIWGDSIKVTT